MYTATIVKSYKDELGRLCYKVRFSDGNHEVTEDVKPQDKAGFEYFVKDRLKSFDSAKEMEATLKDGDVIDVSEPEPEPLTEEEQARDAWLEQWAVYSKANKAMKELTEAGIEPTPEEVTRFDALKTWVADNRKPEYSQFM